MSTVHFVPAVVFAAMVGLSALPAAGQNGPIRPFKDELFSRQTVIHVEDDGAFQVIDYQEMRDINGRDEIPERRVKRAYISLSARRHQQNETLDLFGRRLDVTRVGHAKGARFTVIFIHGRGGDRRLGANDYSFGGNFNRLKNLAADNGGVYYAPSITSFDDKGTADVAALISYAHHQSGGGPVILACASMGGVICQAVSRDADVAQHLRGMVLLGTPPDAGLPTTPLAKLRRPIYFGHGSADSIYKADDQKAVYRKLKSGGYPARFRLFQSGSHGTPIRMIDWRDVLNVLLAAD